jgi:hypothetical protein
VKLKERREEHKWYPLVFQSLSVTLVTGLWFSPGPPVSYTNKIDHHDITEILLKVALNTIKQTNKQKQTIVIKYVVKPHYIKLGSIARSKFTSVHSRCYFNIYWATRLLRYFEVKCSICSTSTQRGSTVDVIY